MALGLCTVLDVASIISYLEFWWLSSSLHYLVIAVFTCSLTVQCFGYLPGISSLNQHVLLRTEHISEWMVSNRLKLNPSKCEFVCAPPSDFAIYLTAVPSFLLKQTSSQLTPTTILESILTAVWPCRPMWVNSSKAVFTNSTVSNPNYSHIHSNLNCRHIGQKFHRL